MKRITKTKKTEDNPSPFLQVMTLMHRQSIESSRVSWNNNKDSLRTVLIGCLTSGMKLDVNDIATVYNSLHGLQWFGADSEWIYSLACSVYNLSACKSYESWVKRQPFIHKGRRLYIGSAFEAPGEKPGTIVKVNSFGPGGEYVNCTCQSIDDVRRFQFTRLEIRTGNIKAKPKQPAAMQRFANDRLGLIVDCAEGRYVFRQCMTFKQAWEKLLERRPESWLWLLEALDSPMSIAKVKEIKDEYRKHRTGETIAKHIDFDRDIAPLLKAYESRRKPAKDKTVKDKPAKEPQSNDTTE